MTQIAENASASFVAGADMPWEELGGGVSRQLLGRDAQLMMVRVRFEAGAVGARHHHPHRQATYVESGTFRVELDGRVRVLQPGDGFFAPPDVEHGVVALEPGVLVDVFTPARADFLKNAAEPATPSPVHPFTPSPVHP